MLLSQTHHQQHHHHRKPLPHSDLGGKCGLLFDLLGVSLSTADAPTPPGLALDLQRHVEAEVIAVVVVALKGYVVLILDRNGGGGDGGG